LAEYSDQVRLQVSIATLNRDLARKIEPRVPPPEARLDVLRRAKERGLRLGVILAPIFPPTSIRPDFVADIRDLAGRLGEIRPDHVFGESLHIRGENLRLVEEALGERVFIGRGFDRAAGLVFRRELEKAGLRGIWWAE
jgi:DNA repair photolyase